MLEGVDGFIRNSYGQVVTDEEGNKGIGSQKEEKIQLQNLKGVEDMIEKAEGKSGHTKAYMANEFY